MPGVVRCTRLPAWLAAFVLIAVYLSADASSLRAQRLPSSFEASISLPAGHWAVDAARRVEAAGLVDGYLPPRASVPRRIVHGALVEARSRAEHESSPLLPLVREWVDRLEEELPELRSGPVATFRRQGGFAYGGILDATGVEGPGRHIHEHATGATSVEDETRGVAGFAVAGAIGRVLAFQVQPEVSDRLELAGAELVLGTPGLTVSVARAPVEYRYGEEGVVLSGRSRFDLVQIETPTPFRFPARLARAGSFAFHAFVTRLEEPRHPGRPYLWGFAGHWQPHPRATVSLHRASMLGGDSVATPLTLRTFARTFIGHNLLGFENEVVATHLRVRLPTERWVPVTVYGEWGAEDAAGAWRDVPGRTIGVYLPVVPAAPALSIGAEYASFAESCCGNPPWYRHATHLGGWADDDGPLGHGLGGQGTQWLGYSRLDLAGQGLRLSVRGFTRERIGENLYVPGRQGRSRGGTFSAAWRPVPLAELDISMDLESGSGWTERAFHAGARIFF